MCRGRGRSCFQTRVGTRALTLLATSGNSGLLFPLVPFPCQMGAALPGSYAPPPNHTSAEDWLTQGYKNLAPLSHGGTNCDSMSAPEPLLLSSEQSATTFCSCFSARKCFARSSPEKTPPPTAPLNYSCFRL